VSDQKRFPSTHGSGSTSEACVSSDQASIQILKDFYDEIPLLESNAGSPAKVTIVGAGLAGLVAGHILKSHGIHVEVFEAADFVGGRIRSNHGGIAKNVVVELGGEFVDSNHWDMLALAGHFGLKIFDTESGSEQRLATAYSFGGQNYGEAAVAAAYSAIAPRIAGDANRLSQRVSRGAYTAIDQSFDRMSISEYLHGIDIDNWFLALLENAYIAEYGLEPGDQSCINLLRLLGTQSPATFRIFGDSDERYKFADGADGLTNSLAKTLENAIHLDCQLVRIEEAGSGLRLHFAKQHGIAEIDADFVILALPFTLLRQIDTRHLFDSEKRRTIEQIGYGTNSKVMIGVRSRIWRDAGYSGNVCSDSAMHSGWDGSRLQPGNAGVYTCYVGGGVGRSVKQNNDDEKAVEFASYLSQLFPGFNTHLSGSHCSINWSQEPFALGSYTCYRPGQWVTLAGTESTPCGNIFFAGEHCALKSQGFMNGAAESGRQAALSIVHRLK